MNEYCYKIVSYVWVDQENEDAAAVEVRNKLREGSIDLDDFFLELESCWPVEEGGWELEE